MDNQTTAIQELSHYVTTVNLAQLPDYVVAQAEAILLDTIGSLLAATSARYTAGQRLLADVRGQGGTPENKLIGVSDRVGCVNDPCTGDARLLLRSRCSPPGAIMHAPAIVVPGASSSKRENRGTDLLTAIVLGIDVACR